MVCSISLHWFFRTISIFCHLKFYYLEKIIERKKDWKLFRTFSWNVRLGHNFRKFVIFKNISSLNKAYFIVNKLVKWTVASECVKLGRNLIISKVALKVLSFMQLSCTGFCNTFYKSLQMYLANVSGLSLFGD